MTIGKFIDEVIELTQRCEMRLHSVGFDGPHPSLHFIEKGKSLIDDKAVHYYENVLERDLNEPRAPASVCERAEMQLKAIRERRLPNAAGGRGGS